MDNVDDNVISFSMVPSWFNWKLVGHGTDRYRGERVTNYHTTLQECVAFCTKKRQDSGTAWNGFDWRATGYRKGECGCNENDTGHLFDANSFHFRV